ncbi:GyrI-like domain-containing protein [Microvirga thermotolerans]|uniref:AraC family transcriptional regulator n=1 Tax=Microvirga thermotolerans TaxID=2651334 RepID=A0A5P9JRL0_9HYPH|nr:GyrI-like domain-containing protein [Microvirga thermotolerans]QFU15013.1 AraC family transcriptional regulator [Microvirga thermotolerans]
MRLRLSLLCLLAFLSAGPALAQTPPAAGAGTSPAGEAGLPPPPAPAPVVLPPPGDKPAAPATQAESPPRPAAPAPAQAGPAPAATARPTLIPTPGDPTGVEEVVLPAKPVAVVSGISNWEDAFGNLKGVFRRIEDALAKAGIAPAGRPLTVFVQTDDKGFRYEAMIPVAQVPEGRTELTPEIRFGRTPEGKAMRFVHKDAYDEIDGTYETITAYLDAKDIVAKDAFIEEYVSEMTEASDTTLEVNIYVQPKE